MLDFTETQPYHPNITFFDEIPNDWPLFDYPRQSPYQRIYGVDRKCLFCRMYCGIICHVANKDLHETTQRRVTQEINQYTCEGNLASLLRAYMLYTRLTFHEEVHCQTQRYHLSLLAKRIKQIINGSVISWLRVPRGQDNEKVPLSEHLNEQEQPQTDDEWFRSDLDSNPRPVNDRTLIECMVMNYDPNFYNEIIGLCF
jgi:hypothetical protein